MLTRGLQPEEIHDIHETHAQRRKLVTQDGGRRERLDRGGIARARHDDVGLFVFIGRSPIPHPDALSAMPD